jgi:hypothetical protein
VTNKSGEWGRYRGREGRFLTSWRMQCKLIEHEALTAKCAFSIRHNSYCEHAGIYDESCTLPDQI